MNELVDVVTTGLIILGFGGIVIFLFALIEYIAYLLASNRDS